MNFSHNEDSIANENKIKFMREFYILLDDMERKPFNDELILNIEVITFKITLYRN
jgi:hypothetical protein